MASGIRGAGAVKPELNSVNADKFKLTAIIKHVFFFFTLFFRAFKDVELHQNTLTNNMNYYSTL
jgi:hypothetical protein